MSRLAGTVVKLLTAGLAAERLHAVVGGDNVRFEELSAVVHLTAQVTE